MEKENKQFKFDEKRHMYSLGGKPLMGVTTVLNVIAKPALIGWAANMACSHIAQVAEPYYGENDNLEDNYIITGSQIEEARTAHTRKRDEGAKKGTDIHTWIESWIQGNIINLSTELPKDKKAKKQIEEFLKWATKGNVEFLESEKRMYSEKY